MNILFIGNSYTFYHDMPHAYFQKIAQAVGMDVEVDTVTRGGWTLEKFADSHTEFGAQIDLALKSKQYDAVILQEQSVRPAAEHGYAAFFDAVRRLQKKIAEHSPRTVLYETWGHEVGSQVLQTQSWSNADMTWRLAASYEAIAKELGLEVAHVGRAFFDILTSAPDVDLYAHDSRSHPSAAGSFLAALILFARVADVDPMDVPFDGDETPDRANAIKQAASRAHRTPAEIPLQYRITSVGVTGL